MGVLNLIKRLINSTVRLRKPKGNSLPAKYFVGAEFKDVLFNVNNQQRERAAVWKIIRSFVAFSALCNDWWKWTAVGIPLDLIDKDQPQGDIDLLIAMPVPSPKDEAAENEIIYRAFEVKTSKVTRDGNVRSLKDNEVKFQKVIKQLDKLREFGAEQIFLLEVYIAQSGYSSASFRFPVEIQKAITARFQKIRGGAYGYVATFIEQITGFDEENTGVAHIPINIHPAAINASKKPFNDLVSNLNEFFESQIQNSIGPRRLITVITYCDKCRHLLIPESDLDPRCPACGKDLING